MQEVIFPAPLVDSLTRIMLLFRIGLARYHPLVVEARPIRIVVWRWLRRTERRLLVLIEAFRAGTLPPPKPDEPHATPSDPAAAAAGAAAAGAAAGAASAAAPERPPQDRLVISNRVGWYADAGVEIGLPACELRGWLEQPEVAELVAAAPQAGRLLRGLLRALGMTLPDYLRRPRGKRKAPLKPPPKPPREAAPQGPPYSTRHPPPEGILGPGEVWIARHGVWVTEREGNPPSIEYQ